MSLYNKNPDPDNFTSTTVSGVGVSFIGITQIVFIILKACKAIDWSWFWVLFPAVLCAGLLGLISILCISAAVIDLIKRTIAVKRGIKETKRQIDEVVRRQKENGDLFDPKKGARSFAVTEEDLKDPDLSRINKFFAEVATKENPKYCYLLRQSTTLLKRGKMFELGCYDQLLNSVAPSMVVHLRPRDIITIWTAPERAHKVHVYSPHIKKNFDIVFRPRGGGYSTEDLNKGDTNKEEDQN